VSNFADPSCLKNLTVPGSSTSDIAELGALASGANVSFSFFDAAFFVEAVGTSALAAPSDSSAIAGLSVARVTGNASLPLLVGLGYVMLIFFVGTIAQVVGLLVASALACARRNQAGDDAGSAMDSETYLVPLSAARAGAPARTKGRDLFLRGESYSIRAARSVYSLLGLSRLLAAAHPKLEPYLLAYAEEDGVFEDDAPGLSFVLPALWDSPEDWASAGDAAPLPPRLAREGYRARLAAWYARASALGDLMQRARNPKPWAHFTHPKGKAKRRGAERSAEAVRLDAEAKRLDAERAVEAARLDEDANAALESERLAALEDPEQIDGTGAQPEAGGYAFLWSLHVNDEGADAGQDFWENAETGERVPGDESPPEGASDGGFYRVVSSDGSTWYEDDVDREPVWVLPPRAAETPATRTQEEEVLFAWAQRESGGWVHVDGTEQAEDAPVPHGAVVDGFHKVVADDGTCWFENEETGELAWVYPPPA
jgi:hypothetical protein